MQLIARNANDWPRKTNKPIDIPIHLVLSKFYQVMDLILNASKERKRCHLNEISNLTK